MDKFSHPDEWISALADGQLGGEAFAHAVAQACAPGSARAAWHTYHVIGDVLRSGELAGGAPAVDFVGRFQQRLVGEPRLYPEVVATAQAAAMVRPSEPNSPAANASLFRWKLVAGAACVAAAATVVLSVSGVMGVSPARGVLVQAPGAPVVAAKPALNADVAAAQAPVMIRNPRLDELLAAHRQSGGASALQMPAGFLRNATHEAPAR